MLLVFLSLGSIAILAVIKRDDSAKYIHEHNHHEEAKKNNGGYHGIKSEDSMSLTPDEIWIHPTSESFSLRETFHSNRGGKP